MYPYSDVGITILRPPETSVIDMYTREVDPMCTDYEAKLAGERIDGNIDRVRAVIDQVSTAICVPVSVYEHQLSNDPLMGEWLRGLPGRKSTLWIEENSQVMIAFEAKRRLIAYLCAVIRNHPVMSSVLIDAQEDDWVPETQTLPLFIEKFDKSGIELAQHSRMHEVSIGSDYDQDRVGKVLENVIQIDGGGAIFERPPLRPMWGDN